MYLINLYIVNVLYAEQTERSIDLCRLETGTSKQIYPTIFQENLDEIQVETEGFEDFFSWCDTNDPNDAKALCVTNPNDLKNKLEDSDDNSITLTNGVQSFNADFSRCATGLNPLASVVRHKIPEDNTIQISLLVKQRASDYAAYAEDPGQCNTGTVLVLEIRKDTTCSSAMESSTLQDEVLQVEGVNDLNFNIIKNRGKYQNTMKNFIILTVCEIVTVVCFFITLILCIKRRPFDHQFYCGEVALYLFMIIYWWARFVITVSLSNEYSKYQFANSEMEGILYMFVFIDAMLMCINFANLIRRVWNSAIIGGNYFLSSRFAMNSLQLLVSTIPKQVVLYLYFSRLLSAYGTIPFSLCLSMWFDLVYSVIIIILQCLDLKYFWRDLQKLQYVSYMSTMIVVNFLMLILEFFISFSILGGTYARQLISYWEWDNNGILNLDRSKLTPATGLPAIQIFETNALNNMYSNNSQPIIKLPTFVKENFGPRFQQCVNGELEVHPLTKECLNVYETIFLSISCIALSFALITSYYFIATSVKRFRAIYRSFRDIDDDGDRWPINKFPSGWLNHSPTMHRRNPTNSSDAISGDRMSFH